MNCVGAYFGLTFFGDILVACGAGAFVWMFKDKIQSVLLGGEAMAAKLRAKADAISAAVKK